jgi:hypothetical protein
MTVDYFKHSSLVPSDNMEPEFIFWEESWNEDSENNDEKVEQ